MDRKGKELKQSIKKSVMIYIIGCCCFVLFALFDLWFGYYVIRYHNDHELPIQLTIISLAGCLLLWEMAKSFRFKTSLPKKFRPITEQEFPALFAIINEVTTSLNLSPIRKVYICPDATAGETQMNLQLLLFTYFAIWICNRINKAYSRLAKQMEYEADDVATKYVGASTLQRALLYAACIRYNYDVIQWGIQQLQLQNIQVDNQYLALSFVGNYSRPARRLLSDELVRRVERLGRLEPSNVNVSKNVQQPALSLNEDSGEAQQLCHALQFAQWLRRGFAIYTQQKLLETSVELEIHLDKKKHKLPYFDGSYKLLLDDKEIGTGNFIKGYTLKRKTSPCKYKLTSYAPSGIISSPFEFETEQDKSYYIEIDYKLHAKIVYMMFLVKK